MATLATPTIVSVEEYLRNPNWEHCDYVDGVVDERGMPTYDHSAWMDAICYWFRQNAEQWNIRVRPGYRNKIRETRYRIPDVSIIDFDLPKEVYAFTPPIAAFEIWSPDDRMRLVLRRLNDLESFGVGQIWTVDPADGVWQRFVDGRFADQEIFAMPERGIAFNMNEISKLVR